MPNVTADQLAAMDAAGEPHHVLLAGGGGCGRDQAANSDLTNWVTENCAAVTGAQASGLYRSG